MSAWGTAQRRPRSRPKSQHPALKGRHYSGGIAESCRPFRARYPVDAKTQGGAARLRRYAVPWAGIELPFQGEERWMEAVMARFQWGLRRQ